MKKYLAVVITLVGLTFGANMMEETKTHAQLFIDPLDLGENHRKH
ncbi:hypothetical protein [Halalkalibacter alkalisediminis]|uniref:Uncharacterized protein n=1 Tax=Halalkalibacter alkalisediminis TaxID=935616 RepID=A0ABV6NKU4_9BACI|nr:hypothetical protein [Halalkalibacter alkalisediminis]